MKSKNISSIHLCYLACRLFLFDNKLICVEFSKIYSNTFLYFFLEKTIITHIYFTEFKELSLVSNCFSSIFVEAFDALWWGQEQSHLCCLKC